jgi:hypothetical protein
LNGTGTVRSETVADAVVRHTDRDHHAVVVAVVGAEDLEDRVAAGVRAGDPDRVHRRLGPRVGEAPLRQAPAARELLGDDDGVLGRHGEVRAVVESLGHGAGDGRVGVPLHHRAEAVVEVDPPRPVHVPHIGALAPLEAPGALVHLARAPCRVVQAGLLARGELRDAGAVERDGGALGHGGSSDEVTVVEF